MASAYAMDSSRLTRLCEELTRIYEYVLVDFSEGIPEELLPILDTSRYVFPMANASPHGVRDLCTLHEILTGLGYREPKLKPMLLNTDDRGADYWLSDTEVSVDFSFPSDDATLARSLRAGQPIPRVAPRSKLARLVRSLLGDLLKGLRDHQGRERGADEEKRRVRDLSSA
jgi:MinD-like ATPase involved in chromosome partitioning or flagellar assembly